MSGTALLVIDMLNTYDHEDAELLTPNVEKIVDPLAELIGQVRDREDVTLLYVNDNYGDFTADRAGLVRSALRGARPDLVEPIAPPDECQFLTKVRHSAFYSTALDYLLHREGIDRLILAGQVTEQCILYSALDAYVRHYAVCIPPDCVAHIDPELGTAALRMMESNMSAEIVPSADCLG